ncbi:MAG: VWA domain-containing protein [Candidatus Omnitrophica bacterium]|nr:VWA domain-containing protein [Candidatus Omnitrophota bacterium]
MKFGALYLAVWLWIIPVIIVFLHWSGRAREKALRRFAKDNTLSEIAGSFDPKRKRIKDIVIVVSFFLLIVALIRPQWGFKWQEVKRRGLNILIALDTSKSMLAEDVLPNRLDRAKLAIKDLVKKLNGDRVGLIVFSGKAFLQCPLTLDYDGFLLTLDDVDVNTVPIGGTSLSNAIYAAIDSYEGGKNEHKELVIITDGEDLEGGIDRAIEKAKSDGVSIYCVGIGAPEGDLIPVTNESGRRVFLKDSEGNVVKTRLEENVLQKMSISTGGMYVRATGAEFGLDLIYEKKLSKIEKQEFKSKLEKKYNERFQIPLIIALLLFLFESIVGDRKRQSRVGR